MTRSPMAAGSANGALGRVAARRLALVLCVVAAAAIWPGGRAWGQERPWEDPDAVDFDEESESRSRFWERALHPNRELYEHRVSRATKLISMRDDQSLGEARALLQDAVALEPDRPDAYWHLAFTDFLQERWSDCVKRRARVYELSPDYTPPLLRGLKDTPWALDYELGLCLSLAGQYERAIDHFTRILKRGVRTDHEVYWRLGEAYMALGRLHQAIAWFRASLRLSPREAIPRYALAVAYDRDEAVAKSRDMLEWFVRKRRDTHLTALSEPHLTISPPADRFYYRALARRHRPSESSYPRSAEPERALILFRHYVRLAGGSPWIRRAKEHIEKLEALSTPAARLTQSGLAQIDLEKAAKGIARVTPALERCVESLPGVLLRVHLTATVHRNERGAHEQGRPAAGRERGQVAVAAARTTAIYSFDASSEQLAAAIHCVDTVADLIALPRPAGPPESSVDVSFPVLAPGPGADRQTEKN